MPDQPIGLPRLASHLPFEIALCVHRETRLARVLLVVLRRKDSSQPLTTIVRRASYTLSGEALSCRINTLC